MATLGRAPTDNVVVERRQGLLDIAVVGAICALSELGVEADAQGHQPLKGSRLTQQRLVLFEAARHIPYPMIVHRRFIGSSAADSVASVNLVVRDRSEQTAQSRIPSPLWSLAPNLQQQ